MIVTSLPYFGVKLSCVCLMFVNSKKSNEGTSKYYIITFRDIFTPPPPLSYCVIIWHGTLVGGANLMT